MAAPVPAPVPPSLPRRLPAPHWEPPYDDEVVDPGRAGPGGAPSDTPGAQGTLALAFPLPGGLPAQPELPARLRLVPAPLPEADDPDFAPQPTPRSALPEPRAWSGKLVQAVLEVLGGGRPAAQLVRWTTSEVYAAVQRSALTRSSEPARRGVRPVVRSLRVCEPADGVAEVSAVVVRGRRTHAVALRMEGMDGRWQCTALQVG